MMDYKDDDYIVKKSSPLLLEIHLNDIFRENPNYTLYQVVSHDGKLLVILRRKPY